MAAAYSMDLRTRVLRDSAAGLTSKELAARYHVTRACVDIELCFAKRNPILRAPRPRTFDAVCEVIGVSMVRFVRDECARYFRQCAYGAAAHS